MLIGRTDVEAETPILWLPHVKSWLIWKDPDAGRDWGQVEKWMTEDEMVGRHHLTRWTWVWVDSGSWWWTGRPGVLQFVGSQRVGHDWATGLNWTKLLLEVFNQPDHFSSVGNRFYYGVLRLLPFVFHVFQLHHNVSEFLNVFILGIFDWMRLFNIWFMF